MTITTQRRAQSWAALITLLPYLVWADAAPQKATVTLEVSDRAALEAALTELQTRGVARVSKIEYAPERVQAETANKEPVAAERIVAERALKKPEAVRLEVELIGIRYDGEGKGVFTTATGTVWRETVASPTRSRLDPRRTYKGVITSGLIGGFRLNVEGIVRELKVEPIRSP